MVVVSGEGVAIAVSDAHEPAAAVVAVTLDLAARTGHLRDAHQRNPVPAGGEARGGGAVWVLRHRCQVESRRVPAVVRFVVHRITHHRRLSGRIELPEGRHLLPRVAGLVPRLAALVLEVH